MLSVHLLGSPRHIQLSDFLVNLSLITIMVICKFVLYVSTRKPSFYKVVQTGHLKIISDTRAICISTATFFLVYLQDSARAGLVELDQPVHCIKMPKLYTSYSACVEPQQISQKSLGNPIVDLPLHIVYVNGFHLRHRMAGL